MSAADVNAYKDQLQENANTPSRKIEAEFRLSVCKRFFAFLEKNYPKREVHQEVSLMDEDHKEIYTLSSKSFDVNAIKLAGTIDPLPQQAELTEHQMRSIFQRLEKHPMYFGLAYFMLCSGLRLSEALQLKAKQLEEKLQPQTETSFLCQRKHRGPNKVRVHLLSDILIALRERLGSTREEYQRRYLERKRKNPRLKTLFSDCVFIKPTGNPIRANEVQSFFAKIGKEIGVDFHSHALRAKKISYDEKYAGISYAQLRANHRHPHTTRGYLSSTLQNQEIEIYQQLQCVMDAPKRFS